MKQRRPALKAACRAQVVAVDRGEMRMYYHAFDVARQKWVVGLALSRDGFKWKKQGPIFEGGSCASDCDARGAAAHNIVRDVESRR